jgi:hypothetical protein
MALRIKSRWHDDEAERNLDEISGALAYILWRLAKDKAINLHGQDFVYQSDQQRMDVILEYLMFEIQLVDRLARQRIGLDDERRRHLVANTVKGVARHVHDNNVDLFGTGEYVKPFIDRFNQRGAEYAEYTYQDDGPSYPFLRHLGFEIQQVMGSSGENRWVIDQVMDQDGHDIDRQLRRAVDNLFA